MWRLVVAYLFRRPVQVLSVLGVAIGLGALLVVLSVMNGLILNDRESARGPLSDLLLLPAVTAEAPRFEPYRAALASVPEIEAAAPHLLAYAVLGLQSGDRILNQTKTSDINGVQVVGIDPELEAAVTGFQESLFRSSVFEVRSKDAPFAVEDQNAFGSRPGVLVSDSLARALRMTRGERIQLGALPPVLPAAGEELVPHNGSFTIAGTYAGQDYDLDMDRIFIQRTGPEGLIENLLGRKSGDLTEILIKLAPGVDFDAGKAAVFAALERAGLPSPGGELGGAIQTWEERRMLYLTAIENERRVTGLVMFFIVIVAAFGLFATVSALVREKVRDLGILAAMGFTPLRRGLLLLAVGATSSLFGTGLGCLCAWLLVRNHQVVERFLADKLGIVIFEPGLYVIQGLPAEWIPAQALFLSIAAFLVGCLFTALPALRAASLPPAEALRYE